MSIETDIFDCCDNCFEKDKPLKVYIRALPPICKECYENNYIEWLSNYGLENYACDESYDT